MRKDKTGRRKEVMWHRVTVAAAVLVCAALLLAASLVCPKQVFAMLDKEWGVGAVAMELTPLSLNLTDETEKQALTLEEKLLIWNGEMQNWNSIYQKPEKAQMSEEEAAKAGYVQLDQLLEHGLQEYGYAYAERMGIAEEEMTRLYAVEKESSSAQYYMVYGPFLFYSVTEPDKQIRVWRLEIGGWGIDLDDELGLIIGIDNAVGPYYEDFLTEYYEKTDIDALKKISDLE